MAELSNNFNTLGNVELVFTGQRPKTVYEAWQITLEKWRTLCEYPVWGCGGASTCGLCMLFNDIVSIGMGCSRCPIGEAGHRGCELTPYEDYEFANGDEERKEVAREELEFLEAVYEEWKEKAGDRYKEA